MAPELALDFLSDEQKSAIFTTERRYRSILLKLKHQMLDKEDHHRCKVRYNKIKAKRKMVDRVLVGGLDLEAERERLANKERSALSKLQSTKIKQINWTNLGCSYMVGRGIPISSLV